MNAALKVKLSTMVVVLALLASTSAFAQRDIHLQINPGNFPGNAQAAVSVFVDIEENGTFKRDLTGAAFEITLDKFAGELGGVITNAQEPVGNAGAQVLILVDISSSYTDEFNTAKKVMRSIVNYMQPNRDEVAIVTTPSKVGFQSSVDMKQPFTSDKGVLTRAINSLRPLSTDDKTGARFSNGLSDALRVFPKNTGDKYRAIIFITGGADKAEGEGKPYEASYKHGLVPFFTIGLQLDRKYDDQRRSHKIENGLLDLANSTGGRSIFRRSDNSNNQFINMFWMRVRNQYHLKVIFPCYAPNQAGHQAVLKVENTNAEIKFEATAVSAQIPAITALYPTQATRKEVDDGLELTIDSATGGMCAPKAISIGNIQIPKIKSHSPYRVVVELNKAVDTGTVTVVNGFNKRGDSPMKFEVIKAPKGAEASKALLYLVFGIVGLAVLSIILVAARSRKAKVPAAPTASTPSPAPQPVTPKGPVAKTVAMSSITSVFVDRIDGSKVELVAGDNLIGRENTCKIILTVPGVSREHAKISLEQNMLWIEDLGSTNGTYWGGPGATESDLVKLDKKRLLSPDDTIWIGGEKLIVRFGS